MVQPGDIVFVPSLPTRVALDTEVIHRGASLAGGEAVVRGLPAEPAFTVPVSDNQSAMMPNGTRVEIVTDAGAWEAFVVDRVTDPASGTVVKLAGADGASICGSDCATLPVTGQTLLRSRIVTVETVRGLVVPSAALLSSAGGAVSVVDEEGDVASGDGGDQRAWDVGGRGRGGRCACACAGVRGLRWHCSRRKGSASATAGACRSSTAGTPGSRPARWWRSPARPGAASRPCSTCSG